MKNILLILLTFTLFACKDKDNDNSIPSSDYELSPDGLTLVKWKNENTTAVDMQADPTLGRVQIIGKEAFSEVKNLGSIKLSNNLIKIEEKAFFESKLKSVIIPKGVQVIGKNAFSLSSLVSVQFSEGLISIDERAFYSCNIPSLNFPESLQTIGEFAFFGNETIVSVIIPKNVQNIGFLAFYTCPKLTSVTFKGSTPPKVKEPFDTIIRVYVPKGKLEMYKNNKDFKDYTDIISEEE